jgi:hypothetical protein
MEAVTVDGDAVVLWRVWARHDVRWHKMEDRWMSWMFNGEWIIKEQDGWKGHDWDHAIDDGNVLVGEHRLTCVPIAHPHQALPPRDQVSLPTIPNHYTKLTLPSPGFSTTSVATRTYVSLFL